MYKKIILIDDDKITNHLNTVTIKKYLAPYTVDILSFDDPKAGLTYITECPSAERVPTLLLLDVSMPLINGWDFMKVMTELPAVTTNHITTYLLSSSIDPADMRKADANPLIKEFISKPVMHHIPKLLDCIKETVIAI